MGGEKGKRRDGAGGAGEGEGRAEGGCEMGGALGILFSLTFCLPLGFRRWELSFASTNLSAPGKAWCWTQGGNLCGSEQSCSCSVTVLK